MKKIILLISFFIFNSTIAQVDDFNPIDFTIADNIAKLNEGETIQNLPLLSYKLTHKLPTNVEKFRAIYTWVCYNIKGDYNLHSKVIKKRRKFINDSINLMKWNDKFKKIAFKKLLKHQKTMCTGYAYLIKELCFLADIECEIVDGFGRTTASNIDELEMVDHSWNAVKLNNKWYLCDATWSSGYMNASNSFVNDYNDGYFLTNPILFAKDHFPIDEKWLLNNQTTSTIFVTSPLVYAEAFKHMVFPMSPTTMNVKVKKNEAINFKFTSQENISIDKISLVHYLKNNEESFPVFDIKNEDGIIKFKSIFKWFGFYDVHLKIGDDIVATYIIEVTNK